MIRHFRNLLCLVVPLLLAGCEGILDGLYDEPQPIVAREGQIVVDASDWSTWHYIDINRPDSIQSHPIPTILTGETDGKSGQYLYWFDVWGEGIRKNEFREFTPCDAQCDPEEWAIAVHRNNVRTNGGEVLETSFSSMDELPETSEPFHNMRFTPDEWSENEVWDSQEQMLLCLIPSQGINVNKVLSSWLTMDIPPMPPAFTRNPHVFILRLKDGTYAALQLANYVSPSGVKCYLTINYKYPY